MTRVAAIDCGTNSIRLLVADGRIGEDGRPHLSDLTRQMRIVRLGQGVDARGYLDPAAIERTVEATVEYQRMIEALGATSTRFVATSATRDASNSADFVRQIKAIIGVEPAGAASMHAALEAGQPISLAKVDPFVDGTAVGRAGALPFHIASQFVDCVLVVPEGAVCTEMLELYQSDGVIAEPAGALASTAAHVYLTDPADRKALLGRSDGAIVCVVSGGNNDLTRYAEVMERSLRHEGLRHYFLVTFPQQPGMLRMFLEDVLGPADDIVHFEYTKKNNRELGPALVGIDLTNPDDINGLRHRMEASPLHVEELPLDSEITRLVI